MMLVFFFTFLQPSKYGSKLLQNFSCKCKKKEKNNFYLFLFFGVHLLVHLNPDKTTQANLCEFTKKGIVFFFFDICEAFKFPSTSTLVLHQPKYYFVLWKIYLFLNFNVDLFFYSLNVLCVFRSLNFFIYIFFFLLNLTSVLNFNFKCKIIFYKVKDMQILKGEQCQLKN